MTFWPQPLRSYVSRCFERYDGADRPALEAALKRLITDAYRTGAVDEIDWDSRPLPWEEAPLVASSATASLPMPPLLLQQPPGVHAHLPIPPLPTANGHGGLSNGKLRDSDKQGKKRRSERAQLDMLATDDMLAKRAKRFDSPKRDGSVSAGGAFAVPEDDGSLPMSTDAVVGLSEKLERSYLRLTSAPDPRSVRPPRVLRQTLELLKQRWRDGDGTNYGYVCDQFKSMRQDLTVQRVRDDFACTVYETHARVALEKGDLGEYNQCQAQLRQLYRQLGPEIGRQHEFLAYRLLYLLHTRNARDADSLVAALTESERRDPAVAHALAVRRAVARGNYAKLFGLHADAPNMGAYLIDHFVDRERLDALVKCCRAYRPTLALTDLAHLLGLTEAELHVFLTDLGHDLDDSVRVIDTKAALPEFERHRKRLHGKGVDIKGQI